MYTSNILQFCQLYVNKAEKNRYVLEQHAFSNIPPIINRRFPTFSIAIELYFDNRY